MGVDLREVVLADVRAELEKNGQTVTSERLERAIARVFDRMGIVEVDGRWIVPQSRS
jgi:hypothetical protein